MKQASWERKPPSFSSWQQQIMWPKSFRNCKWILKTKSMIANNNFKKLQYVRPWDTCFLENGKTRVAQNLCNLTYLIRQRQKQKKTCSWRFSRNRFVYLNFFRTLFKNVHCQGSSSVRLCISRPLYFEFYSVFQFLLKI